MFKKINTPKVCKIRIYSQKECFNLKIFQNNYSCIYYKLKYLSRSRCASLGYSQRQHTHTDSRFQQLFLAQEILKWIF